MTDHSAPTEPPGIPLSWLADAPLFIDAEQVSAFYDAVVMPENETEKISISTRGMNLSKTSVTGKVGVRFGASALLAAIFPFVDAQANIDAGGGQEASTQSERGDLIELRPVTTPHRQLVQLALHYAANLPGRVSYVHDETWERRLNRAYAEDTPRALVFLDLPPRQPIVPLAVELTTGRVVTLFDDLAQGFSTTTRTLPPEYPSTEDPEQARRYWAWFSDNFQPLPAMAVLERGIGEGGLARWVDYRVRVSGEGWLQLSMRGRGKYETGIYAYSTIRRGHKYGLRVVGTLKSGPGLNVLAVFER